MTKCFGLILISAIALALSFSSEASAANSSVCSLSIDGAGYIALEHPSGIQVYAREGKVKLNRDTRLTLHGLPIVGAGTSGDATRIIISKSGVVTALFPGVSQSTQIGAIGIVRFARPRFLVRIGKDLFREPGREKAGLPLVGNPGEGRFGKILCKS